jgi:hypothetical protein
VTNSLACWSWESRGVDVKDVFIRLNQLYGLHVFDYEHSCMNSITTFLILMTQTFEVNSFPTRVVFNNTVFLFVFALKDLQTLKISRLGYDVPIECPWAW